jgi:arsenical pump membrane protein
LPLAFAVFLSAGVAALPVSNPMNMLMADYLGISFNAYAATMIPVAVCGWLLAFLILRRVFARELAIPAPALERRQLTAPPLTARLMLVLLAGVLLCYSLVGYLGGPVWIVALGGGFLALVLVRDAGPSRLPALAVAAVSWETLAFLFAVLVLSMGLLEVGVVDRLGSHYAGAGVGMVGVTSAVGSALLNNHPMSYLNMLALDAVPARDPRVFAALIGGDLGPRLLPIGSLAGLLWLEMLRRKGIEVHIGRFVKVGAVVGVPTLVLSLAVLSLFSN